MRGTDVFTQLQLPKTSHGFSKIERRGDLRGEGGIRAGVTRIRIVAGQTGNPVPNNSIQSLRHNIAIILTPFEQPQLSESYEAVCMRARLIVYVERNSEGLYDHLRAELAKCLNKVSNALLDYKEDDWIGYMGRMCDWYHDAVALLQSLLYPLDQERNIKTLAYELFNNSIFGHSGFSRKLQENLEHTVVKANGGLSASMGMNGAQNVRHLLQHLITHDVYSEYEAFLLNATEAHYTMLSSTMAHGDPIAFFDWASALIHEEVAIAQIAFPLAETHVLFKKSTEKSLFILSSTNDRLARISWFATAETVKTYVDQDRIDTLGKVYSLFKSFSQPAPLHVLRTAWRNFIHNTVSSVVQSTSPAEEESMVPTLLRFKTRTDEILGTAFGKSSDFTDALSDGFSSGFKTRRDKPAEMLAKYLDGMMRKGQAKFVQSLASSSSADTPAAQDALFHSHLLLVLSLYRYTHDKDVFRTFYHRFLAKRLLLNRSASSDAEKRMLEVLTKEYDAEFGMGEQMFKDLVQSDEIMSQFRDWTEGRTRITVDVADKTTADRGAQKVPGTSAPPPPVLPPPPTDYNDNLQVRVLQRGAWPFSVAKNEVLLTDEMRSQIDLFTNFYQIKHFKRKLEWDHALGTMSLKTRFRPTGVKSKSSSRSDAHASKKPRLSEESPVEEEVEKELSVSIYQGIVLLIFQSNDQFGFMEIKNKCGIDDPTLRLTLQSLACGKKKVLKKIPPGRDVDDDDVFVFNEEFPKTEELEGRKGYRIHVNGIQGKVEPAEARSTHLSIQSDRKHLLDAALVRIMKAAKTLPYQQLTMKAVDAVKVHFKPEVDEIKRRIDVLVEMEFIERVQGERGIFKYLA